MASNLLDRLTSDPEFLSLPESEQDKLYEELSGQKPRMTTPVERTESRIASRRSAMPSFSEEVLKPETILDIMGRNVRDPLRGGRLALKGLGAGLELLESVTASPFVSMQAKRPVGQDLMKVLSGERVVERGDIARNVGAPEPLAAMFGLATSPETLIPSVMGAKAGVKGIAAGGRAVGEFLRGSPQRIQQAEKAAHQLVQSVRQGGPQVRGFFQRLGDQAEKAWAPMKQVTSSIEQPIEVTTLRQLATERFGAEPHRLQGVFAVLDDVFGEGAEFTASNLVDLSSEAGRKLPGMVLRGAKARTQLQQFTADARSVIADAIEQAAPDDLKGAVGQAKTQWANYAADRDRLFQLFQPGSSPQRETKVGINFLRRAAEGQLSPSEQEFLGRLTQQFPELSTEIARIQKQLGGAIRRGAQGQATAQFGKRYGPGASLVGAGAVLARIFGQK